MNLCIFILTPGGEIFKEQTDGQSDYSNDPRESESQSPGQGPPLKEELNGT